MANILKTVALGFPIELVWQTLTNSDDLGRWLMPNDFKAELGHKFIFQTDPAPGFDGIIHCKVLSLDPMEKLQIEWNSGKLRSVVTFTLKRIETGTLLSLIHEGFETPQIITKFILSAGWKRILNRKLPQYMSGKILDE